MAPARAEATRAAAWILLLAAVVFSGCVKEERRDTSTLLDALVGDWKPMTPKPDPAGASPVTGETYLRYRPENYAGIFSEMRANGNWTTWGYRLLENPNVKPTVPTAQPFTLWTSGEFDQEWRVTFSEDFQQMTKCNPEGRCYTLQYLGFPGTKLDYPEPTATTFG